LMDSAQKKQLNGLAAAKSIHFISESTRQRKLSKSSNQGLALNAFQRIVIYKKLKNISAITPFKSIDYANTAKFIRFSS